MTERQTFRFETFDDEVLDRAFTEVRHGDRQSEADDRKAPNAFQEAIMKTFARRELCYRTLIFVPAYSSYSFFLLGMVVLGS